MPVHIARLPERALIRVEGPDWRPFLHNLLTHDLETLETGGLRFTALLTPQGRLLHDLFVLAGETGTLLDVAATGRDALIKRLTLYKLRAKVTVEAVDGAVAVRFVAPAPDTALPLPPQTDRHPRTCSEGASSDAAAGGRSTPADATPSGRSAAEWAFETSPRVTEGDGEGWAPDPRLPELGWRALGYDGPTTAEADAYHAHRLALGVPDPMLDGRETDYPLELNFDLLNGIDFKKGCFIGQETTSRMKRRAAVKTRAVPVAVDGLPPPPGTEVLAGDLRAGELRRGMEARAIALLRLDRAASGPLTADGRPVRMDAPPWLAPHLV